MIHVAAPAIMIRDSRYFLSSPHCCPNPSHRTDSALKRFVHETGTFPVKTTGRRHPSAEVVKQVTARSERCTVERRGGTERIIFPPTLGLRLFIVGEKLRPGCVPLEDRNRVVRSSNRVSSQSWAWSFSSR